MVLKGTIDAALSGITQKTAPANIARNLSTLTDSQKTLAKKTLVNNGFDIESLDSTIKMTDATYKITEAQNKEFLVLTKLNDKQKTSISQDVEKQISTNMSRLATDKLSEAQYKEILMKHGYTEAEAAEIAARYANATATDVQVAALDAYVASLWASIKATAIWLATNPVGWLLLAAGGIAAVVSLSNQYQQSIQDNVDATKQAYDETTSSLESMNSEYETAISRIAELQELKKNGTATSDEIDELAQLQKSNELLAAKIKLYETLQVQQRKTAGEAAIKSFNESDGYGWNVYADAKQSDTTYATSAVGLMDTIDKRKKYIQDLEKEMKALADEGKDDSWEYKFKENQKNYVQSWIDKYEAQLAEMIQALSVIRDQVNGSGAEGAEDIVAQIDDIIGRYTEERNPKTSLAEFANDETYANVIEKLKGIKDATEMDYKTLEDDSGFSAFTAELANSGFLMQQFLDYINAINDTPVEPEVNTKDFEDANTAKETACSCYRQEQEQNG